MRWSLTTNRPPQNFGILLTSLNYFFELHPNRLARRCDTAASEVTNEYWNSGWRDFMVRPVPSFRGHSCLATPRPLADITL